MRIGVKEGIITGVEAAWTPILLKEHLEQSGIPEAFVISQSVRGTDARARWVEVAQRGTKKAPGRPLDSGNVQIASRRQYALARQEHHACQRT